jgi:hypothetical protein
MVRVDVDDTETEHGRGALAPKESVPETHIPISAYLILVAAVRACNGRTLRTVLASATADNTALCRQSDQNFMALSRDVSFIAGFSCLLCSCGF